MVRPLRTNPGGFIYHVLNRGNGKAAIFLKEGDYEAFERVLAKSLEHVPGMRLLAYCLMSDHWHLILWPRCDGDLSDFMHWLTLTHTRRRHAQYADHGGGHLYQGRFKSFPIQEGEPLFSACHYVEQNALRAGLVTTAEAWRWSSLNQRVGGQAGWRPLLADGPQPWPEDWLHRVNLQLPALELEALRRAVERGQPYGGPEWVRTTAELFGLLSTLRPRGRPRKRRVTDGVCCSHSAVARPGNALADP